MSAKGKPDLAEQIGNNRDYLKFADKLRLERPDLFKKVVAGETTLKETLDKLGYDFKGSKNPSTCVITDSDHIAEDEYLVDEFGHEIPEDIRECWATLPEFAAISAALRDIRKRCKVLCDQAAGAYLERALPEITAALKSVEKELKAMAPCTICPHCNGSGCNQCRGMGWIPRGVFDLLSEDEQQRWAKGRASQAATGNPARGSKPTKGKAAKKSSKGTKASKATARRRSS